MAIKVNRKDLESKLWELHTEISIMDGRSKETKELRKHYEELYKFWKDHYQTKLKR